ncbi:MAG: hypothetical protein IPI00_05285 [Flavobacteriales bacterium]|nr:hypothetical protein [Flavobacteriales bacterium]MBK6945239.1 hypothetical protein [Flavobacteriales bacterium]MBK7239588.1 hypothetical protein [Flavobacteriales bacterium]MBK9535205.1 hypothetical protein [Flavobacteriales bacterium]MBP9137819.1 hypothetical protein [Flavobacteriales bacterium]
MKESYVVDLLFAIHGAAGIIALIVAPVAMYVAKGSNQHRLWGKLFFYSMVLVTFTAIILSILRPNLVMAMLAIFSFHLVASGYRSLYHKKLHEGQRAGRLDWILQGVAGLFNVALFLWGAAHTIFNDSDKRGWIFLIFGAIGILLVVKNTSRFFKKSHDKQEWLYGHMTGFLAGYIATLSAFSVVNMEFIEPSWLRWIWPTLIGAPLIMLWVRYYRARFVNGRRPKHIMDVRIKSYRS